MEKVYTIFEEMVTALVIRYTRERHNRSVRYISKSLKSIYKNKECFEYTLNLFYADFRNPFTTAYSQFMNEVNENDDVFWTVSENILMRRVMELGNEYAVFVNTF